MIGWTALTLLTCVHGGDVLDLLRAGATSAREYQMELSTFPQEMEVRHIERSQIHKSEIGYMSWEALQTQGS